MDEGNEDRLSAVEKIAAAALEISEANSRMLNGENGMPGLVSMLQTITNEFRADREQRIMDTAARMSREDTNRKWILGLGAILTILELINVVHGFIL